MKELGPCATFVQIIFFYFVLENAAYAERQKKGVANAIGSMRLPAPVPRMKKTSRGRRGKPLLYQQTLFPKNVYANPKVLSQKKPNHCPSAHAWTLQSRTQNTDFHEVEPEVTRKRCVR